MIKRSTAKDHWHADFSICMDCHACGGDCALLNNHVVFVIDNISKEIKELTYDRGLGVCGDKCTKPCMSNLHLTEALAGIVSKDK